MLGNSKHLGDYARVIRHRVVRPIVWNILHEPRLSSLSDDRFFQLLDVQGPTTDFLSTFHDHAKFRFFFHPRNKKDFFLDLLARSQPYDQILEEAQDVLENRFATLGSAKVHLGDRIQWHKDFKSGREWPIRRLTIEEILDLPNPSDIKVLWELSRFHQVWWLGKAHWLTGGEQYAIKFRDLVEDWIKANPVGKGPNWTTAMEVAIRACNWIAGYYFFCESSSIPADFWMRFLKSLYAHGVFISHHLEFSSIRGNHFLSNVTGLIFLGIFFRDTNKGRQWLQWGLRNLEAEMNHEVYPDGVNHEKSTSYHRLVLELFYSATILCQKNRIPLSPSYLQRLERMFEVVLHYTRPDGSIPLIGDADDGRLFRLSLHEDVNDHRHALSVGAMLFKRTDFKVSAARFDQEALWYFGGEGFEIHQLLRGEPGQLPSRSFPEGGFYIMQGKGSHAFIDAGDIGLRGKGGHGHNDTLSFELWMRGAPLLTDSGTYCYSSDVPARQEFRSVRAHNTITIDHRELAEFIGLWNIREDRTSPRVNRWESSSERDLLEAEHHGYDVPPLSVIHRRTVVLSKDSFDFGVTDSLLGTGLHEIEGFLHFAPSVDVELVDGKKAIATNRTGRYIVAADAGEFSMLETWFSERYGIREQRKSLRLFLNTHIPVQFTVSIRAADLKPDLR